MARRNSIARLSASCSAAALLQAMAGGVHAQTPAAPPSELSAPQQTQTPGTFPTGVQAAQNGTQLSEVVVTARKSKENIITTPVAVTALTAAALEARDITNLETLGDFAPGFHQTDLVFGRTDRGYQSYEMRGIYGGDGQERQPVQLFLDGAPISSGMIEGLDDVDRVEVIKGPQSAYFGRSTFGGAINFITRPPSFTYGASASADYASYNYTELKAEVEGPLIDNVLSARLSGRYYNTDGDYDNAYGSGRKGAQETKSISADVLYKPTSNLTIKGFAQYWEDLDGPSAQGFLNPSYYNCNPSGGAVFNYTCGAIKQVPGSSLYTNTGFSSAVISALDSQNAANNVDSSLVHHEGLGREAFQSVVSFEYDLPNQWVLSGNAGVDDDQYRVILDAVAQPSPTTIIAETVNDISDFSGEIRLQSPEFFNMVRGLIGVNYLDSSINGIAVGYEGSPTQTNVATVESQLFNAEDYTKVYSRTLGLFFSLHFDLTDKLKFDLEGREQSDDITEKVVPDAHSLPGSELVDAEKTFYTFTPKATLSYLFRPNLMGYVSYAAGSRPGQFNVVLYELPPAARSAILSQANVPLAVSPEKLDMYETGLKGELFDRRLRLLLSAYYGRWYGRQVTSPVLYTPPGGGSLTSISVIASDSTVNLYGLEAEGSFKLTEDVTLEGTFGYNESDIRRTYCVSCLALTGNANPVGNVLPGYAPYTGTASLNYVHDLFGMHGFGRLDYIYSGKQYEQEDDLTYVPPSNQVNVRVGLEKGHYSVELYGKNIFDDKTPTGIFTQTNSVTGGYGIEVAPPIRATIGIRLSAKY